MRYLPLPRGNERTGYLGLGNESGLPEMLHALDVAPLQSNAVPLKTAATMTTERWISPDGIDEPRLGSCAMH